MSSWDEFIAYILATSSKVDKMVVYGPTGQPIATTDGLETVDSDGLAFIRCINDKAKNMTKIGLDNTLYLCIHGIDHTLVGRDMRDENRMLVAHTDAISGNIVVLIGKAEGSGSFIYELKNALSLMAEGNLVIPSSPGHNQMMVTAAGGGVAATEQVLIDLH